MLTNNTETGRRAASSAAFRPARLYCTGFLLYSGLAAWVVSALAGGKTAVAPFAACFLLGAVVPGGFNAFLLERYWRKGVLLRVLTAQMIVVFGLWPRLSPGGRGVWAAICIMGCAFALQQVTLASTLLNDLVVSEQRTRVDMEYAWVCLGGAAAGAVLASAVALTGLRGAALCAGVPFALAFLTALPLEVRLKAPVSVGLYSLDRYFRADCLLSCGASALSAVPFGFLLGRSADIWVACALLSGVGAGFGLRHARCCAPRARFGLFGSQLAVAAGLALLLFPDFCGTDVRFLPAMRLAGGLLAACGASLALLRTLGALLEATAHCLRGTSQHTHFLGALAGAACGLLAAAFAPLAVVLLAAAEAVVGLLRGLFRR